jgi:ABC-type transport system substrate-binding protein
MAARGYWELPGNRRVSRRGILHSATVGIGGVAFAAACGGSNSNGNKPAANQGPASGSGASFTPAAVGTAQATSAPAVQSKFIPRTNTTAQAVPGGTWASYTTADVTNLDSITSPSFTAAVAAAYMYPRLINFKAGASVPADGSVTPGFAESWEQPDQSTTIMHLRKNAIWDRRAPTNGRQVDSSDVVFTWNRFADKSPNKNYLNNAVDPNAPIKSMEAVDQYTVKINQAFPFAPLLAYLAFGNWFRVYPKESDGGFDPKTDTRGFGPWILQNYQRSVVFQYKRNPDYYLKDQKLPFLDGIDYPIIAEYAAGLAQFKAKKVWTFAVRQEDIVDTYQGQPELLIDKNAFLRSSPSILNFGLRPGSPFLDKRVRQAVSMLVDRDTWIDTFGNVNNFNKAGFGVNVRWHSHISSGEEAYWVDPKSAAAGNGGKNFQFNQAEAKKLLQAAGQTLPVQTDIVFISTGEYGTIWPQYGQAFKGILEDGGLFKLNVVNPDYQTEWVPKYVYSKSDFNGFGVSPIYTYPDVGGSMYGVYHTNGRYGYGSFQGKQGDPQSDQLIEAQLKEFDTGKRKAIIQDWQKYMADQMTAVPFPGQAETFTLQWPWLSNFGAYRIWLDGDADESLIYRWFDKSKFTG